MKTSRRGFLGTIGRLALGAAAAMAGGVAPQIIPRKRYLDFRVLDIDTALAEEAGRRVAEEIERCILGLPSKYGYHLRLR